MGWTKKHVFAIIHLCTICLVVVQSHSHVQLLRPHQLQHVSFPVLHPLQGACSNSCPLNQWCYPTISSSVIPFSSCLQSFLASGSFLISQLFTSCGQSVGASASASVLPMNIQNWCPLGLTGLISLQSTGLSKFFPASQFKSINYLALSFMVQLSHPYMTVGKTIALTRWTFTGKAMSLLFNILSRLVIAFLPRSKCLLISLLQLSSAVILKPKKIKSVTFPLFPHLFAMVMEPDAMIIVFWMLSIKPAFFTLLFHFHQETL